MNTAMVAVLLVGGVSLYRMHREFFPEFELEIIFVSVPYPGASPEEVEESICQRIEEAVRSLQGIKRLSSVASEGVGSVILELEADVRDVQKVLNEVRSEVDRLPGFPPLRAEEPEIKQVTLRRPAIKVAVVGPDLRGPEAELKLRTVAEQVRDEVLQLPAVSQADIGAAKDFQIDVEISESTLRKYGLSLRSVADLIRRENIEVPAGVMRTSSQELLLRGKNKRLVGDEIATIPLVTRKDGAVLTIDDLATVYDYFVDTTSSTFVDGKPGMVVRVSKTTDEDLLAIVAEVRDFVTRAKGPEGYNSYRVPEGYRLVAFDDSSILVRDRLELLRRNGLQGLILVFVILAAFLELRLAFWVALGIPVSILGGCGVLFAADQTLNMLSMFAFLMALGILVDDAIVIGENVYSHRQQGKGHLDAAVDGTCEVLPSVLASVSTTIIAFMPLLLVPGIMGKFIAVIPLAVIVMLLFSLLESTFVLPCHLAHSGEHDAERRARYERRAASHRRRFRLWTAVGAVWCLVFLAASLAVLLAERGATPLGGIFSSVAQTAEQSSMLVIALFVLALAPYLWYPLRLAGKLFGEAFGGVNRWVNRRLDWTIGRVYLPSLRWTIDNPWIVLSLAAFVLLISLGLIQGGIAPFTAFPKMDVPLIQATVVYPDGTPESITDKATQRVEQAILRINEKYAAEGQPVVQTVLRSVGDANTTGALGPTAPPVGSHAGGVAVELVDVQFRPKTTSMDLVQQWREAAGEFPGAEEVSFGGAAMGPGGMPIEFKLLAAPRDMAVLERAAEKVKEKLRTYPGVLDITDDSRAGKWEFHVRVKDKAEALGVTNADLAETIRASYYGEEVMRLQRGRHEVKLMVRYPREERYKLAGFDEIRVRTHDGVERPITELADVKVQRGYSRINRLDQLRSITITADVDESRASGSPNATRIVNELRRDFMPGLLAEHPGVRVRWEGQAEQTTESVSGLIFGLAIALACMFALLTLEFQTYSQPIIIMAIIPFGAIGAVFGHVIMGFDLTLMSLFGLVALTGVVVNDSIVLVDFINHRVRDGLPLKAALVDAGRQRFRPVILTSMTTIGGLLPLLLERSFQARVLQPMAASLAFGLMFATLLVLLLVPSFYLVYAKATGNVG
jgi:multidrug efflux pump subunit AcrB